MNKRRELEPEAAARASASPARPKSRRKQIGPDLSHPYDSLPPTTLLPGSSSSDTMAEERPVPQPYLAVAPSPVSSISQTTLDSMVLPSNYARHSRREAESFALGTATVNAEHRSSRPGASRGKKRRSRYVSGLLAPPAIIPGGILGTPRVQSHQGSRRRERPFQTDTTIHSGAAGERSDTSLDGGRLNELSVMNTSQTSLGRGAQTNNQEILEEPLGYGFVAAEQPRRRRRIVGGQDESGLHRRVTSREEGRALGIARGASMRRRNVWDDVPEDVMQESGEPPPPFPYSSSSGSRAPPAFHQQPENTNSVERPRSPPPSWEIAVGLVPSSVQGLRDGTPTDRPVSAGSSVGISSNLSRLVIPNSSPSRLSSRSPARTETVSPSSTTYISAPSSPMTSALPNTAPDPIMIMDVSTRSSLTIPSIQEEEEQEEIEGAYGLLGGYDGMLEQERIDRKLWNADLLAGYSLEERVERELERKKSKEVVQGSKQQTVASVTNASTETPLHEEGSFKDVDRDVNNLEDLQRQRMKQHQNDELSSPTKEDDADLHVADPVLHSMLEPEFAESDLTVITSSRAPVQVFAGSLDFGIGEEKDLSKEEIAKNLKPIRTGPVVAIQTAKENSQIESKDGVIQAENELLTLDTTVKAKQTNQAARPLFQTLGWGTGSNSEIDRSIETPLPKAIREARNVFENGKRLREEPFVKSKVVSSKLGDEEIEKSEQTLPPNKEAALRRRDLSTLIPVKTIAPISVIKEEMREEMDKHIPNSSKPLDGFDKNTNKVEAEGSTELFNNSIRLKTLATSSTNASELLGNDKTPDLDGLNECKEKRKEQAEETPARSVIVMEEVPMLTGDAPVPPSNLSSSIAKKNPPPLPPPSRSKQQNTATSTLKATGNEDHGSRIPILTPQLSKRRPPPPPPTKQSTEALKEPSSLPPRPRQVNPATKQEQIRIDAALRLNDAPSSCSKENSARRPVGPRPPPPSRPRQITMKAPPPPSSLSMSPDVRVDASDKLLGSSRSFLADCCENFTPGILPLVRPLSPPTANLHSPTANDPVLLNRPFAERAMSNLPSLSTVRTHDDERWDNRFASAVDLRSSADRDTDQDNDNRVDERGLGDSLGAGLHRSGAREREYTDVDLFVSRLEGSGREYEGLSQLASFFGPSKTPSASPEAISTLLPGLISVDSRRTTPQGKVKLKLSLLGVRVSRCPVCLSQFRNGEQAILTPICGHAAHQSCALRWFREDGRCFVCREMLREE
ncbi:hypothetical protein L204_105178 [Cryptococcus depauperatus]|nr:hypothetical protein L204_03830 [Cryptococcus depauperatus CBS 7855]